MLRGEDTLNIIGLKVQCYGSCGKLQTYPLITVVGNLSPPEMMLSQSGRIDADKPMGGYFPILRKDSSKTNSALKLEER